MRDDLVVHVGSPRAMFVSREAMRAEVHANAGSSQSLGEPVSAVLLTRFRGAAVGRTAVPPDVAFGGWTARRSLTGNCLKSPSREHGQAVLTSDAAGQVY